MNEDKSNPVWKSYENQDGEYEGYFKVDTLIQHGLGVCIDTKQDTVYEGWLVRNKKEIYGRLIYKHGLIYQGEFRNNLPDGRGRLW